MKVPPQPMQRLAASLLFATLASSGTAQGGTPTHADLVFATVTGPSGAPIDLKLDLYLPTGASAPTPLVIWVHGGGWKAGSKSPCTAAPLTASGYAVASVDYRLSGTATWPAQIHDCKAAVRWLRANAAQYGIDPDRFGAWGSSAGGQLVTFLGTSGGVETGWIGSHSLPIEGTVGAHLDVSSRVQAVVDSFGPTNFPRLSLFPSVVDHDAPSSPESELVGVAIQLVPEASLSPDPTQLLSGDDPPTLLIHGTADMTVPFEQSEHLWREAREVEGLNFKLIAVPDAGHGGALSHLGDAQAWFDLHLAPRATTLRLDAIANASEGGGAGALRITRSGPQLPELAVALFADGTAEAGRDYQALPQVIVLPAGVSTRVLSVVPIDDALVEGPEQIALTLVPSPDYAVDSAAERVELGLADDEQAADLPQVQLVQLDRVAVEGTTDRARVRFARSGPTDAALMTSYAVRGIATPGEDHDQLSGQLEIPAGSAFADLVLTALDDGRVEPAELWVVELLPGVLYRRAAASIASGRIDDDEALDPAPRVGVSTQSALAAEGGAAAIFLLSRTGATSAPLSVDVTLSGSALPGQDYALPPTSLSFAAGEAFARLTLDVTDDNAAEGLELVRLRAQPGAGYGLVESAQRQAELTDNDGITPTASAPVQVLSAQRVAGEALIDLVAPPGSLCALYLAPAPGYLELLGQPVLLDAGKALPLFVGAAGADGTTRLNLGLPDQPGLLDAALYFQVFALGPGGQLLSSALEQRHIGAAR